MLPMVRKTSAEKMATLRAKRQQAGLQRFELWLHPSEWPLVKRYIERLAKRREQK